MEVKAVMNLAPEEYLKDRVDDQINWYDRKSQTNQRWYKWLRIMEVVAAASIPFLVGYMTEGEFWIKFVVGFLGVVVTVITGIIGLYRFQENWIEYRTTCESLKHEKYLFLTQSEPYAGEKSFPFFVERIEALISTENTKWYQRLQSKKKGVSLNN